VCGRDIGVGDQVYRGFLDAMIHIRSKQQVTNWADTYTELVDIADRMYDAGVLLEVQTRGRAPHYQYAIFRLYVIGD